ncbi:helix-turn-helix domain-containing protein [Mesorhizobium sp. M0854]|uniref:helix-turn-helix domain-containing protein n=1 Tax=Mesorhizobium sp. M0854 TaxID=2957013 RepID=UPI00333DD74F
MVELVLSRPLVSGGMIQERLKVTKTGGAQSGRRAWAARDHREGEGFGHGASCDVAG